MMEAGGVMHCAVQVLCCYRTTGSQKDEAGRHLSAQAGSAQADCPVQVLFVNTESPYITTITTKIVLE